jgi:Leu/Phe-tRNA-protein transferase
MYCRPELGGTDASKVALVRLASLVKSLGYEALDAQILNPHTAQFGTYEIPDDEYLDLLARCSMTPAMPWPAPGKLEVALIHPWRSR